MKVPYILVVDDEPDARLLAQMILHSKGFEVGEASGGAEALAKIADRVPDAMLLDIRMPELDGWAVLKQMEHDRVLAGCKVIMLSADTDKSVSDQIEAMGAHSLLTKPIGWDELLDAVSLALSER